MTIIAVTMKCYSCINAKQAACGQLFNDESQSSVCCIIRNHGDVKLIYMGISLLLILAISMNVMRSVLQTYMEMFGPCGICNTLCSTDLHGNVRALRYM